MPQEYDPARFVRGLLPAAPWGSGSRLPAALTVKLTADTVAAGRVPAGVHLALAGTASAVELEVVLGAATSVPAPTVSTGFLVRAAGGTAMVELPARGGTVRIPLPERDARQAVRIYLPEHVELTVLSLRAVDGELAPVERRPLFVAYGDSISQGWSVSAQGLSWPSLIGESLGLDVVNLGFAGSARGELPAADAVAGSAADVVAVAWGTNAWSSLPADAAQIAETVRIFLTALRQGLPEAPLVVVSPIVRPDAERTPNRFGATLHDLRRAIESAVTGYAARTDDPRITLVGGVDLVLPGQLVDGIHPGDAGQAAMAAGIAPHVHAALELRDDARA